MTFFFGEAIHSASREILESANAFAYRAMKR